MSYALNRGVTSWPNETPKLDKTPLLVEQHNLAGVPVRVVVVPASEGRWEAQLWANSLAIRQVCPTIQQATSILYDWLLLAREQVRQRESDTLDGRAVLQGII